MRVTARIKPNTTKASGMGLRIDSSCCGIVGKILHNLQCVCMHNFLSRDPVLGSWKKQSVDCREPVQDCFDHDC